MNKFIINELHFYILLTDIYKKIQKIFFLNDKDLNFIYLKGQNSMEMKFERANSYNLINIKDFKIKPLEKKNCNLFLEKSIFIRKIR